MNSGHRRSSAFVIRSVGDDNEPKTFSTWGGKAIAKIGALPSTIEDRAIVISMKRKAPGEKVERFFQRKSKDGLTILQRKLARWAKDNSSEVKDADPGDLSFLHDRANDNWRPLLAIADAAGGQWPELARKSAKLLSGVVDESNMPARIQALIDIRDMFEARQTDRLPSAEIVEELGRMEDRPWPEWKHGKAITTRQLASLLKPFGVSPKQFRDGEKIRGYRLEQFEDVFLRYVGGSDPVQAVQPNADAGLSPKNDVVQEGSCTGSKCGLSDSKQCAVPDVPDKTGGAEGFFLEEGFL